MFSYLVTEVDHCHALLWERLEQASNPPRQLSGPGAVRMATDGFLIPTSQHLAAAVEVLVPEVGRSLDDGRQRARALTRDCKRLGVALARTRAKQYGQAQAVGCSWPGLWKELRAAFGAVTRGERELVELLAVRLGPEGEEQLCARFRQAQEQAGTRPHPYIPHSGPTGRVLRRIYCRLDRIWDEIEGRVIPPTPQPAAELTRSVEVGLQH